MGRVRTGVGDGVGGLGEPQGDETEYGFALGAYDPGLPLVIDPQIAYASFIGGSGADSATILSRRTIVS